MARCRGEVRQSYIHQGKYLNYNEVQKRLQSHEAYKALPAKVSQQVLMQLHHDWESFFKARDAYVLDPSKFLGRPKLPKYKHKTEGRNLLIYTLQAIYGGQSKKGIAQGIIKPSRLAIEVKTKQKDINNAIFLELYLYAAPYFLYAAPYFSFESAGPVVRLRLFANIHRSPLFAPLQHALLHSD